MSVYVTLFFFGSSIAYQGPIVQTMVSLIKSLDKYLSSLPVHIKSSVQIFLAEKNERSFSKSSSYVPAQNGSVFAYSTFENFVSC